jgi:hypothetical protein
LLICQHLIGVPHPVFAQIAHLFGDQAKLRCARRISIMLLAPGLRRRGIRAQ